MSRASNQIKLAIFGDRAFAFEIPEDEFDQLQGHIAVLIQASNASNIIVAQASPELVALKHIDAAEQGAAFITAMAATMMDTLVERR